MTNLEKNLYRCLNKSYKHKFLSLPMNFTNILDETYNDKTCSICLNTIKPCKIVKTYCNHFYCINCISKNIKVSNKCPNCRQDLNYNLLSYSSIELQRNKKINYIKNLLNKNLKLLIVSDYDLSIKTLKKFINNANCFYIKLKDIDTKEFLNLIKLHTFHEFIFIDDTNINQNYYLNIIQSNINDNINFTLLKYI